MGEIFDQYLDVTVLLILRIHLLFNRDIVIQRRSSSRFFYFQIIIFRKILKLKVHFNNCFSYEAPKLWNDLPLEI